MVDLTPISKPEAEKLFPHGRYHEDKDCKGYAYWSYTCACAICSDCGIKLCYLDYRR